MISASHANPKPWMEFSERIPAPEAGRPPYPIICHFANRDEGDRLSIQPDANRVYIEKMYLNWTC